MSRDNQVMGIFKNADNEWKDCEIGISIADRLRLDAIKLNSSWFSVLFAADLNINL